MSDPLPGFEPPAYSVDDGLAEAREIVDRAVTNHQPSRRFLLFSGGNDSLVVLDALAPLADEVVHVNTGIGIPETTAFARRVARRYSLPFTELSPSTTTDAQGRPNRTYESLVLDAAKWNGLPGPGAHRFTYTMLKERSLEHLLRHHRTRRGERFMFLTGARRAESKRRMGGAVDVERRGGQVWVNPLLNWSHRNMAEYRQGQSLPTNEVSANLHMSGECLCGAMADQDHYREEREMIRFWYPGFESRLTRLENQCKAAGLRYCEWGVKRKGDDNAGPMCQCAGMQPLPFDETPIVIKRATA